MQYLKEYERWLNNPALTKEERDSLKHIRENDGLIQEQFGRSLTFGTAGLRGICGLGTNRMNRFTVRRASQGLADYLNKTCFLPSVVISYDSRLESRSFAEETACVFVANGIKTYLFDSMMPVPVLSYTILKLGCCAGVMITASHNPKEYNGYKVYNRYGGQILDGEAEEILGYIEAVDLFRDIHTVSMAEAQEAGLEWVPPDVYDCYLEEMDKASSLTAEREIHIVYTPLNGSGLKPVSDILTRKGFDFFVVPEQEAEDGNFPTCPSPNPEKEEVYCLAKEYGEKQNADILIATDPDCDRVGVMVKHQGIYQLLSGNEIGLLMLNYICEVKTNLMFRFVYSSLVSTPLIDSVAASYGVSVKRTPVGFKYIGRLISRNPDSFLFGFEESNGYLMGTYARDKDGAAGAYIIAQMAAYYKAQGLDLVEVLESVYQRYGYVLDKTISVDVSGMEEMEAMMEKLRDKGRVCSYFAGLNRYVDYRHDQSNELLAGMNLIEMNFEDGTRIIVRPSGTEPKIKMYYSVQQDTKDAAMEKLDFYIERMKAYEN